MLVPSDGPRPVHELVPAESRREYGRKTPVLILGILVFGMAVGWLAQLVLGLGTRPDAQSLIAGLAGSFVGGLLFSLIAGDGLELRPSGLIGSFIGAVIVLLIWTQVSKRSNDRTNSRR
jgi:uncharacterized membrane protein YeaQ/YmgE (transglycosylase-associated protein family)